MNWAVCRCMQVTSSGGRGRLITMKWWSESSVRREGEMKHCWRNIIINVVVLRLQLQKKEKMSSFSTHFPKYLLGLSSTRSNNRPRMGKKENKKFKIYIHESHSTLTVYVVCEWEQWFFRVIRHVFPSFSQATEVDGGEDEEQRREGIFIVNSNAARIFNNYFYDRHNWSVKTISQHIATLWIFLSLLFFFFWFLRVFVHLLN